MGDGLPRDEFEEAQTVGAWDAAGAISLEEKVRTRRPDWDEDAVDEEVERIKGAQEAQAPRSSIDNTRALIERAVNGKPAENGESPTAR